MRTKTRTKSDTPRLDELAALHAATITAQAKVSQAEADHQGAVARGTGPGGAEGGGVRPS
jgi:hypothetical protein